MSYTGQIDSHRMAASTTLEQGYVLNYDSSGLLVDGDDTSGESMAGICYDQKVVSDASGKYNDSAYGSTNDYAQAQFQVGGEYLLKIHATSNTSCVVGQKVYCYDGSAKTVAPADLCTNDVEAGRVRYFTTGENSRTKDLTTTSITSDTWGMVWLKHPAE